MKYDMRECSQRLLWKFSNWTMDVRPRQVLRWKLNIVPLNGREGVVGREILSEKKGRVYLSLIWQGWECERSVL